MFLNEMHTHISIEVKLIQNAQKSISELIESKLIKLHTSMVVFDGSWLDGYAVCKSLLPT